MKSRILIAIASVLILAVPLNGQSKKGRAEISGTVTDPDGNPIYGATIVLNGQWSNVITDLKGEFMIRIRSQVNSVGAYSAEAGSAQSDFVPGVPLSLVLDGTFRIIGLEVPEPDSEKEINVGYGTLKKKDMVKQIDNIDATEDRYASYSNIYELIRGQVPGVQVNGTSIIIRGPSSINMSSQPLLVVDGVPTTSIETISPKMVKSITILKGADAAIYGTRAAGGVILIDLLTADDLKNRK